VPTLTFTALTASSGFSLDGTLTWNTSEGKRVNVRNWAGTTPVFFTVIVRPVTHPYSWCGNPKNRESGLRILDERYTKPLGLTLVVFYDKREARVDS